MLPLSVAHTMTEIIIVVPFCAMTSWPYYDTTCIKERRKAKPKTSLTAVFKVRMIYICVRGVTSFQCQEIY